MTRSSINDEAAALTAAQENGRAKTVPSNCTATDQDVALLRSAFVRASDVTPTNVRWYWRRRIVRGQLNILAGTQGVGKSGLALHIAAEATRRGDIALIMSAEDDDDTTIVPRLIAAGADLDKVLVFRHDFELWLPEDFGTLQRMISASGAAFVVLDPVISFIGGETNSWRDHDVRRVLRELRAVARETRTTFLGLMHPKKGEEAEVVNIVSGAVAWTAAPRSTLIMTRALDEDGGNLDRSDSRRVLFHVKCNVGREQLALEMKLEPATIADDVHTAKMVIGDENPDLRDTDHTGSRKNKPDAPAREAAEEWLRNFLTNGPKRTKEVQDAARAELHSPSTLKRAKESLGIQVYFNDGAWRWSLTPETGEQP